jgi:hypothetical protein
MRRLGISPPPPALIVGVIALVAALAGTAVAERAGTSAKAVTKKKAKSIANDQIDARLPWGSEEIADGAVTNGKLADGAVTTAKIGAGAVRASKLGTITVRQSSPETSLAAGTGDRASVSCNAGERIISGGVSGPLPNEVGWAIYSSQPLANGWEAGAFNNTTGTEGFRAYALCLQAG